MLLLQRSWEGTKAFPSQLRGIISHVWVFILVGHTRNPSHRKRPGGNLIKCFSHLSWLLLMWRCSNSTASQKESQIAFNDKSHFYILYLWSYYFSHHEKLHHRCGWLRQWWLRPKGVCRYLNPSYVHWIVNGKGWICMSLHLSP